MVMKRPYVIKLNEKGQMKISKTLLETFRSCPYRFKKLFLERVPIQVGVEAKQGRDFHKFAFEFFDVVNYKHLLTLTLRREVVEYLETLIPNVNAEQRKFCGNFVQFEADHYLRLRHSMGIEKVMTYFVPIAREVEVETDAFFGHIDRVDLLVSRRLLSMEYKTVAYFNKQRARREGSFYAMIGNLSERFTMPFSHTACYNARVNQFAVWKLHQATFRSIDVTLQEMKEAMESKKFGRKFSGLCSRCQFSGECLWSNEVEKEVMGNET